MTSQRAPHKEDLRALARPEDYCWLVKEGRSHFSRFLMKHNSFYYSALMLHWHTHFNLQLQFLTRLSTGCMFTLNYGFWSFMFLYLNYHQTKHLSGLITYFFVICCPCFSYAWCLYYFVYNEVTCTVHVAKVSSVNLYEIKTYISYYSELRY